VPQLKCADIGIIQTFLYDGYTTAAQAKRRPCNDLWVSSEHSGLVCRLLVRKHRNHPIACCIPSA